MRTLITCIDSHGVISCVWSICGATWCLSLSPGSRGHPLATCFLCRVTSHCVNVPLFVICSLVRGPLLAPAWGSWEKSERSWTILCVCGRAFPVIRRDTPGAGLPHRGVKAHSTLVADATTFPERRTHLHVHQRCVSVCWPVSSSPSVIISRFHVSPSGVWRRISR